MGRPFRAILLMFILLPILSGCADIRSKFIRESKQDELTTRYIPVREYDVRPNMELYSRRYIFWNNWHKEFIDLINDPRQTNQKKFTMAIEQAYSNLYDMRKMLSDEKGDELQLYIDRLGEIKNDMESGTVTHANRVRLMRRMDVLGREIRDNFSSKNVVGEMRDEFRED